MEKKQWQEHVLVQVQAVGYRYGRYGKGRVVICLGDSRYFIARCPDTGIHAWHLSHALSVAQERLQNACKFSVHQCLGSRTQYLPFVHPGLKSLHLHVWGIQHGVASVQKALCGLSWRLRSSSTTRI